MSPDIFVGLASESIEDIVKAPTNKIGSFKPDNLPHRSEEGVEFLITEDQHSTPGAPSYNISLPDHNIMYLNVKLASDGTGEAFVGDNRKIVIVPSEGEIK